MDAKSSEEIKAYDFHSGKSLALNLKPKFWLMGLIFSLFFVLSVYFNAVVVDQKVGRAKNVCYIGLHLLSGRKFWIKYFENSPDGLTSSQAEEFMNELSRNLRLPINKIS
jgi:hypothetical protein